MLVDTFTYPSLLRAGSLAVVLHQSVRAIVELKGELVPVKTTEEDEFRGMLIQVGRTKDKLALDDTVLTALLVFDDKITVEHLTAWVVAAIKYRNALLPSGESKSQRDRDALSTGMLPKYIVTSGGVFVEKEGATYLVYKMGDHEAIVSLLARLLGVAAVAPADAQTFGILPSLIPSAASEDNQPGALPARILHEVADTRETHDRLALAFSEFTAHFGLLPAKLLAKIDLSDSQPGQ